MWNAGSLLDSSEFEFSDLDSRHLREIGFDFAEELLATWLHLGSKAPSINLDSSFRTQSRFLDRRKRSRFDCRVHEFRDDVESRRSRL